MKKLIILICLCFLTSCVSYKASYNPETGFINISGNRLGDQQLSVMVEKTDTGITMKVEQVSQATALTEAIKTIDRLTK